MELGEPCLPRSIHSPGTPSPVSRFGIGEWGCGVTPAWWLGWGKSHHSFSLHME